MGSVGGMLGLAGGQGGSGFSTQAGTDAGQLKSSYNDVQGGMAGQRSLLEALKAQNGLQNQSNVYNQFQNVASGQGPNPAQAMLNQSTGANVANQAALMAGQRGAGANAGLMARQAAQQGGALQQQAAGQGASMQAQQSLGALGQAAGMANNMAGQQIGQTNQNVTSQQGEQQILQSANSDYNKNQTELAKQAMSKQGGGIGSLIGGLAGVAGTVMGGPVGGMIGSAAGKAIGGGALGGEVPPSGFPVMPQNGPQSMFGKHLMGGMPAMASGGKVPAMVSPGERFLEPQEAAAVADGKADPTSVGEKIPGNAPVKGDSYKNDIVRKDLKVGGIVIPRSIENSKNPGAEAKKFVDSYMAKKKVKKV